MNHGGFVKKLTAISADFKHNMGTRSSEGGEAYYDSEQSIRYAGPSVAIPKNGYSRTDAG
jgi:hypothetical protein